MSPGAEIALGQHPAHRKQARQHAAVGGTQLELRGILHRSLVRAQQGEVLHQLLVALHDVVGKEAGLVLLEAHGAQGGIIVAAAVRQRRQFRPT